MSSTIYSNSRPYLNCFEQGEEFLVNALAKDHLRPPSVLPYNFSVPVEEVNTWGQYGQPAYIDEVFFKGQVSHRQWLVSYPLYSCLHTRTGQAYTRPSFHSLITLLKRSEDGGRCMASEIYHIATHDWITVVFLESLSGGWDFLLNKSSGQRRFLHRGGSRWLWNGLEHPLIWVAAQLDRDSGGTEPNYLPQRVQQATQGLVLSNYPNVQANVWKSL